jgi:hypothetical protein
MHLAHVRAEWRSGPPTSHARLNGFHSPFRFERNGMMLYARVRPELKGRRAEHRSGAWTPALAISEEI